MKKTFAIFISLIVSIPVFGAGWVYMGYYPYLYDADSTGWSYSPAPIIWHQDIQTGEWREIGNQPENVVPETFEGKTIGLCTQGSCWEAHYTGYRFTDENYGEGWIYIAMLGGHQPDQDFNMRYQLVDLGNNTALLTASSKDMAEAVFFSQSLVLTFLNANEGTFVSTISIDRGDIVVVSHDTGSFELVAGDTWNP